MTRCARCGTTFDACRSMGRGACCGACATNKTLHGGTFVAARYVFHPTKTGHVSHGAGTTPAWPFCDLCDVERCAECHHSVEDDAHADGCEECACPLHLTEQEI